MKGVIIVYEPEEGNWLLVSKTGPGEKVFKINREDYQENMDS